jgi:adenosylmethionine-8-amino-7-oxononanoate aminotransferase
MFPQNITKSFANFFDWFNKSIFKAPQSNKPNKHSNSDYILTDTAESHGDITPHMLQNSASNHLWLHFTRHHGFTPPIMSRAEGCWVWDINGKKYFDGLSGLFTVNIGHGNAALALAASQQMMQLDFFPLWSYQHEPAIRLAEKITQYTPEGLSKVFFTSGGGDSVETAWKLAKQYFKLTGHHAKHKVISRETSYHGTPHGALSITGIPDMKKMFEPLVPSTFRVPNTNWYRAHEMGFQGESEEDFYLWAASRVEEVILQEGPETVAAVFVEPVQNSGGCFTASPTYFKRLREICDMYNVLLVADETITGWGRMGTMFASERYEIKPDMIVTAKGLTSGYAPLGALIVHDRLFEPFNNPMVLFPHGYTFGGHPVSCAVALANIKEFEAKQIIKHVQDNEAVFKQKLEQLKDLSIVGDVRGAGYFYAIELVKDKATKETFNSEESEKLLRGFLSKALFEEGLYCRADDRGDPVIQLAPPLIAGEEEFEYIYKVLRKVLTEAENIFR